MSDLLIIFSTILAAANLFAIMIVAVTISEIYNMNSIYYEFIASTLCIIINFINIVISVSLDSSGSTGSALLIQIGILTTCILAIKMILKDDYKRNVKPNLQIKL